MRTDELAELREEAIHAHRGWKRRSFTFDTIASDQWQTVWDDLTSEMSEPLVENVVLQALEDKTYAAGSLSPQLEVHPTRGTRQDRAERAAEKKRRVMMSYWDRSDMDKLRSQLFIDWFGHGATYLYPWADLYHMDGSLRKSAERFPYLVRANPRHVYPLSHNMRGRMTSVIVTKLRRVSDVEQEYGKDHPAIQRLRQRAARQRIDYKLDQVEETWYFDETISSVMISARPIPSRINTFRYVSPIDAVYAEGERMDEWLFEPSPHGMNWCPMVEIKRLTNDGEYRSPLDVVIPRIKVAHQFMARLLDDVADSVYGPVLMEGILNPEEYGPGAELIGDGQGRAKVEYPRQPVNFEARQVVADQLDMSRRDGRYPEQRAGEAGASIITGKGTNALMGSYSDELRAAHNDVAGGLQWATSMCAHYDEVHGAGTKEIEGIEDSGAWVERYDPVQVFDGDYRCRVSYGAAAGHDKHNFVTLMTLMRSQKAVSQRRYMRETGMVDDVLQEERDILIEDLIMAMEGTLIQQAAQAGNMEPLRRLIEKIDDDSMTIRQAVFETIKEAEMAPTGGGAQGGQQSPDPLRQAASVEAGGSGSADAIQAGGRLRQVLPSGVNRALNQTAPGG